MNNDINRPKVIGFIMTYKHAGLVEDIYHRLPKEVFDEIIIFDDASGDDIVAAADRLRIPIFIQKRNLGYGGNVKYSIKKCIERGAEYMIEIHGDGQYGGKAVIPGLQKMKEGYDLVLGSRFTNLRQPLRDKMSLARYLANIGLSFFDRLVLRLPLSEFHTGFRIYNRKLTETVDLDAASNNFLLSFEVIVQAKYHNLKIAEVPVRGDYSKKHTSISIKDSIIYAFQTFYVLFKYILARLGFTVKLFNRRQS